jgi:hypothetical protein
MISHYLPASFPTTEKKRGNRETDLKEQDGVAELTGVASLSLPFHGAIGLACIRDYARAPAKLGKLGVYDRGGVSYLSCAQGFCISCCNGGYIVACAAFYEQGFGVPSHRFLHSLLWSYGLGLHHLTPLRICKWRPS